MNCAAGFRSGFSQSRKFATDASTGLAFSRQGSLSRRSIPSMRSSGFSHAERSSRVNHYGSVAQGGLRGSDNGVSVKSAGWRPVEAEDDLTGAIDGQPGEQDVDGRDQDASLEGLYQGRPSDVS